MSNHFVGTVVDRRITVHQLDAIWWGLFFVWAGIALLANLGWGIGILGVGILILGGQAARKYLSLTLETFWALVGALFVLGGVWELLNISVSLLPVVCIVVGVLLLVSALLGKPRDKEVQGKADS
jgi:hypothetical protein